MKKVLVSDSLAKEGLAILQAAAGIQVDVKTGLKPEELKAIVGGYDFFRSEFNRAVQAKRQPGSAFKPFVYAAAIESGFTPATRVDDAPVTYPVGRGGSAWKPENYDRKYRGPTTLQQAIEESVNVVTGMRVTLVERERYLGGRRGAWGDRLADGTPFEMER